MIVIWKNMKKRIHNIIIHNFIYVTLWGLLCPGVALAEDWGGDYLRRPYVHNVLGVDPATLTTGQPVLGTDPVILESSDNVIMWGKHRESTGKPDLSLEYNVDSNYLVPSDPSSTDPAEDWATVGSVYHYTYPIKYQGKQAVLSVRFIRKVEDNEPTNIPFQSVYNVVFDVFVCRDNNDRASNPAPDFTWRIDWDNDFVDTQSTDCVKHPLMLCPIESKFFMCGYLTEMPSNIAGTGDNTGSARRRNDIFATTFDLVTFDANNPYNGTVDGTDEVFLFADEYVWVFNLSDNKVACHHLKTCGTHFTGEETFPDTYKSEYYEHCGVNSDVDWVKGTWFAVDPVTWGATSFSRPRCDDEDVVGVPDSDLNGIFAIANTAGDKYFGIWIPQGDTSRITFRYLGHKTNAVNHYEQEGGYNAPCYTTIDLVAHEVTPYNNIYCVSFDDSVGKPSDIRQNTNEEAEHYPDDPVLLFAWTDYQYSSLLASATPAANTSLLLLPTDTETIDSSSAEYSRNFSCFLSGDPFWTEFFSKDDSKANTQNDYTAGSKQTVVTRPEIGVFRPSSEVASSMIFFNRRFFTYTEKEAGSQGTILQYYYELSDQDGEQFGDDLFRVSGNPVVNDIVDGTQKLWFLAWIEDSSTSRNYDWQLFNVSSKWVLDSYDNDKLIDGTICHQIRLQPVITWGGASGYGNLNGAAAGIAPYPVPYPILKYERSYANATNPTLIWTVSAPPLDADNGLTWHQYAYDAPSYSGDAISWSAPTVMLESSQTVRDAYWSLIQSKLSLSSSTVTGRKAGFGYLCRDYLTNKDSVKDPYLGDTFTYHEDNTQVTFAYLPVDSHVYSIQMSDGTSKGEITISQLSKLTTVDEESGETITEDETYHYKQMGIYQYQMYTGGMVNVANLSGLYTSVEGAPSSYVNVRRSYVIDQDENKDNYAKATVSSDAVSNVAKYFNNDATNFVIGTYDGWNETYDEEWFYTYPLSYTSAKSYTSTLHATNEGECWTPESTSNASATVTWKDGLRFYSYLPMKYNDVISYTGLQIRPVWYVANSDGQQWNASDWMVLQEDPSLLCTLSLLSSSNSKEGNLWTYGHHLSIYYDKSNGVEITNDSGLYRHLDGSNQWEKVGGGVTGNIPDTYKYVTLTDEERDAFMEKGIYSVYAYYKVVGEYYSTIATAALDDEEDSNSSALTPFESNEVKVFLFSFNSTGVDLTDVDGNPVEGPLYDLMGRLVKGSPKPGIYITGDGRKVKI